MLSSGGEKYGKEAIWNTISCKNLTLKESLRQWEIIESNKERQRFDVEYRHYQFKK